MRYKEAKYRINGKFLTQFCNEVPKTVYIVVSDKDKTPILSANDL